MAAVTIDVMIPAYGDGPLLRKAIHSVLDQHHDRWALTVVDDGPADEGLADWVGGLDHRVEYLHNPETLGINRNFQRCFDLATRDLVVLLGADDRLLPSYVGVVTEAAAELPEVAMLQPGVLVVDGEGRPAAPLGDRVKRLLAPKLDGGRRVLGGEPLLRSLLRGNWMYFPAVAFRRSWVQRYGFRPGLDVVQDLDLYARMLFDGAQLALLPEACAEYRRHDESLSSVRALTGERFAEERAFFAAAARRSRELGWSSAARAADAHLSSRLHALVRLPAAARTRDAGAARALLQHATRLPRRSQPAPP